MDDFDTDASELAEMQLDELCDARERIAYLERKLAKMTAKLQVAETFIDRMHFTKLYRASLAIALPENEGDEKWEGADKTE